MPLTAGTRLGPYEILSPLGAGGMGEVYTASDTNLKRRVAIKVLPASVAADAERLARFQREAEVLAALNHPNIAGIYGLERSGATTGLVMELVEGEDLAQRIARGAIPIDEALPIAQQIAEALEAAHEQGIIHRDLKPANIKVRADGTVKVLDFGLAKALEPAIGPSPHVSQSPTITTPAMMTGIGMILGTAAYMSPEQARGKAVDKRCDVWAFGLVLFEMLSGAQAFDGEDLAQMIGAIIQKDPIWDRLPAKTPTMVRTVLQRCLQKDPKERIRDIGDVQLALNGGFDEPMQPAMAVAQTVTASRPLWRRALPVIAALVVGAVIARGAAIWQQPRAARDIGSRFALDLVPVATYRGRVAVSPDGQRLAVVTAAGLFVRERNVLEPRLVHKAETVAWPFFSPDGLSIGFYEDGRLKRIASDGGTPVVIASVASVPFGGGWSHDDTILFGQPQGIMRVNASGGMPELVIPAKPDELVHGAQLLPDGRTVLYSAATRRDWVDAQVVAQPIGGGDRVVLVKNGSDARYVPTGHLVYGFDHQLFAVAFDAERLAVRGRPESIVQGLQANLSGSASYGISDDGVLAYVGGGGSAFRTSVWVDRQGREVPVGAPERPYDSIKVSPDGSQLLFRIGSELWTYSLGRAVMDRVTSVPAVSPVWSPSGKDLVYYTDAVPGGGGLFRQSANGSGALERLATGNYAPLSWSRDGRHLVYLDFATNLPGNPPPDADLGLLTLDGARPARPLMKTPAQENNSDLSPDGHWIAIKSNELGGFEVFVRRFPDVDAGRWRISTAGGVDPVWARDGHALYFRQGRAIMEVAVTGSNPDAWGRPVRLFEGDYVFSAGPRLFDIAPDDRFAMLKQVGASDTSQPGVIVVFNWTEALKRVDPTK